MYLPSVRNRTLQSELMRITLKDLKTLVYKGEGYDWETEKYPLEVVDPIIGSKREIVSVKLVKTTAGDQKIEIHLNKPNLPRARIIKPEGGPTDGQKH